MTDGPTSEPDPTPTAAMAGLRRALDAVSDALVAADLDRLIEAETDLGEAVARATANGPMDTREASALRQEATAVRQAVLRCRRLGLTLNEFGMFSLLALGSPGGYTKTGTQPARVSSRTLDARA